MSQLVGDTFTIKREPPGKCELCGAVAELRPYGPNGENICVDCGMKDIKGTEARMLERMIGARTILEKVDLS